MTGFVIFAIVFTLAYVVYYAVIITKDLVADKEKEKTKGEIIDVENMDDDNEEPAVDVSEKENGFSVAGKSYDTLVPNDESIIAEIVSQPEEASEVPVKKTQAEKLKESLGDKLERTSEFFMIDEMLQDELVSQLLKDKDTPVGKPKIDSTLIKNEI